MSEYQMLIFQLNKVIGILDISESEKKELMDACELMESDSMDIAEFSENLIAAIRLMRDKAPQALPTMLLIASEIAQSRI